ncbi:MAG: 1-acyl-sn-glycerol-3-phosphate acyltransferase [Limisphaerales bacterium]|nr:MAG: 1-acyl-sn-glycerol-3-phosphate acyltransferase [Limisphaerales bacterium]KAG0507411.1 MAG: 1-acyl-sn-glycerol-3-phosphate acyltransferase [Limisphaerales bacterium]TXT51361.1 MAG: 1-acyl-sn-glycerol-3-phosphate acyltransferase [Limisphaerales bacterium]
MNHLRSTLRSAGRLGTFLGVAGLALLHSAWLALAERKLPPATRRARWLRRWCRVVLPFIGVEVELRGRAPDGGLLVCNHVSYLDMPALTAATEMVFLSKAEVRRWPLLGPIARAGGTLFVNRQRRADVADLGPQFVPVIEEGVVLTLFPEGTSTGGDRVLSFHSSLLAPAAQHDWPVTPAFIRYEVTNGVVEADVAYWRDMTFLPHFLNLLGKRRVRAIVHFGAPLRNSDRKALARELHRAVCALAGQASSAQLPAELAQPAA